MEGRPDRPAERGAPVELEERRREIAREPDRGAGRGIQSTIQGGHAPLAQGRSFTPAPDADRRKGRVQRVTRALEVLVHGNEGRVDIAAGPRGIQQTGEVDRKTVRDVEHRRRTRRPASVQHAKAARGADLPAEERERLMSQRGYRGERRGCLRLRGADVDLLVVLLRGRRVLPGLLVAGLRAGERVARGVLIRPANRRLAEAESGELVGGAALDLARDEHLDQEHRPRQRLVRRRGATGRASFAGTVCGRS